MNYAKLLKTPFSLLLGLPIFFLSAAICASAAEIATYSGGDFPVYYNSDMTPDEAYRQLVAGNARYLREDSAAARSLPRLSTAQNRFPIASVVYSSDMPVKPTVLTQTSDHDLYLTTVDSGAVSIDDLTSIEYGLINLQTPLLVVMGHYPSRTVSSLIRRYDVLEERARVEATRLSTSSTIPRGTTSDEMKLYNLVGPAVARSREAYPDLQGYDLANVVSEALVWQSLETILMKSTVAQDLIRAGRLNVIAAIADDKTGKIYWLGAHPLQEEFLKPLPQPLVNKEARGVLTEADLPAPLDDATIQEYVSIYESDPYYEDVVSEYYTAPIYYQPSWELFSPRAWVYRPWYGVWYDPFVPWPYWSPWGVPYGESVLGVSRWDGRLRFFIAYNRSYGVPIYYDPHFRPHDPWWGSDYFVRLDRRRHDVVFDFIIDGRRHDVPVGPQPWRGPHEPHGYRPGAARPGIVVGLGGISIGISGSPRRPIPEPGRPGGPVAPGPRVGFEGSPRPDPIRRNNPPVPVSRPRDVAPRPNSPVRPPSTTPDRPNISPRNDRPAPNQGARPRVSPSPVNRDSNAVPRKEESRPTPSVRPNPNQSERPAASPRGERPAPSAGVRPAPNQGARPRVSPSPVNRDSNAVPRKEESRPTPSVRPNPNQSERPAASPRGERPAPSAGARPTPKPAERPATAPGAGGRANSGSNPVNRSPAPPRSTPPVRQTSTLTERLPSSPSGIRPASVANFRPNRTPNPVNRNSGVELRPTPSVRPNPSPAPRQIGVTPKTERPSMGHGARP